MSILPVSQIGEPVLRKVAVGVADPAAPDLQRLIGDLHDTLLHWRSTTSYGRGIAAPQAGESVRIIVLDIGEGRQVMINPVVLDRSDRQRTWWDACLSCLHLFGQVARSEWTELSWLDETGGTHRRRFDAAMTELLEHELDHLDGILYLDRVADTRTLCSRVIFERDHRAESPYAT